MTSRVNVVTQGSILGEKKVIYIFPPNWLKIESVSHYCHKNKIKPFKKNNKK